MKPASKTATRKTARSVKSPEEFDLDRMERWVQEVVTHPQGVSAGIQSPGASKLIPVTPEKLENVILPSKNLSSLERLGIYSSMYTSRLVECLEHDFSATRHAVGPEKFTRLAEDYVAAHPSTHYSLNFLNVHFPGFLRSEVKNLPNRRFLASLAELEVTIQTIIDERRADPISVDDLLAVPRDKFAEARFRTIPALRLMAFAYPVNEYLQAVYNENPIRIPAPKPSWLVVYRKDYRVWRAKLDFPRYTLLTAIAAGKPLGDALEICVNLPGVRPERLANSVGAWFKEWAAERLFCGVELA